MEYRIALTGSASAGKTTTARLLSKTLGIALQPEIETQIRKAWIKSAELKNKDAFTPELSKKFFELALNKREKFCKTHKIYITDRSAAELYVYFKIYLEKYVDNNYISKFSNQCKEIMQKYTHIFLFPYGQIPLKDNNVRTVDKSYQLKIHNLLKETLEEFSLNYIRLSNQNLTRKERLEEILKCLKI